MYMCTCVRFLMNCIHVQCTCSCSGKYTMYVGTVCVHVFYNSYTVHEHVHELIENHNSLGHEWPLGRDVKQSPNVQEVFQPIPGLISCARVTGCVDITRHARATQMADLKSSQSHSLVAYSRAHLQSAQLPLQSD